MSLSDLAKRRLATVARRPRSAARRGRIIRTFGHRCNGTGTTTRTGGKFLPATPETYDYDDDGNLTTDGRFTYTWDAENRLIAMETLPAVPTIAKRKLSFAYDAMSRRIRKTTWHGTSTGTWQLQQNIRFIHEPGGWNILAEVTGDGLFLRTYTWGTDLSGNLSGAGGVGGLLFTKIHGDNSVHANGMDINGNVSLLVSTATGQATATYDYGPFAEPLRQSGEYAMLNPYRFSTKYTDDETGLLDYGYRYYDPLTGRWPSRDPIGEEGGINLYGFVGNDLLNTHDLLGLKKVKIGFYGANLVHLMVPGDHRNMGADWYDGRDFMSGSDRTFESTHLNRAENYVIKEFDKNNDGKLDSNDCPPFDLRVVGFSWGGWTALELSHNLYRSGKIKNKKDMRITMGTIDPVPTIRSQSGSRPRFDNRGSVIGTIPGPKYGTKAKNVVRLINFYETNGLLSMPTTWLQKLFAGVPVQGAQNYNITQPTLGHVQIGTYYGQPLADDIFGGEEK